MIALYKRLSLADGDIGIRGKEESNSIEHQGDMLNAFVSSRHEFRGVKTIDYVDDGYTGINFERPAFKKMMEGVRNGEIDTIIVKDISRFGRDYIGVGEYLEQLFPLLGVRFIAINNNYDSINYKGQGLNLDMAVNNLVNTMYSRDIGKKLRCSNEVKWKKGYSTGSSAPFGYVFDSKKKGRFVIDDKAAGIVRYIFDLALKGCNTTAIAYELNEKKIPIPSEYNRQNSIAGKKRQYTLTPDKIWNAAKVWRILRSYEYTGAMVLGKSRVLMPGTDVVRNIPDDGRYITENTHEAIVTHEEWDKAQQVIRKKQVKAYAEKSRFPLKKKIRCGHCMRAMYYNMRLAEPKVWCREGKDMPKHSGCPRTQYSMRMIEKKVWSGLQEYIKVLMTLDYEISEYDKKMENKNNSVMKIKKEEMYAQKKEEKLKLYEKYAQGSIGVDEYKHMSKAIEEKIKSLNGDGYDKDIVISSEIRHMAAEAKKYAADREITKEASDEFIENVYVHGADRIEVHYLYEKQVRECIKKLDCGSVS